MPRGDPNGEIGIEQMADNGGREIQCRQIQWRVVKT
jgi:hypothetical protein